MADTPLIAGSWEDLLDRAGDLSERGDPACIPLFEKCIERLGRMNAAQLDAGDGYLRALRAKAAFGLNHFLFSHERYAEALDAARRTLAWAEEEEAGMWRRRMMSLYVLLGRGDDAEAEARRWAEESDDADLWGDLAVLQIRRSRFDAAAATLDRMEKQAGRQADPQEAAEERAQVATLRASLALKQGHWAEAMAWHTSAVAFSAGEAEAASYIYSELVRSGEAEAIAHALPLIARDSERPVRAALWRGLALRAQGKADAARRAWETAAGVPYDTVPFDQQMDWILCNFFLGDAKRRAQAAALRWVDEARHAPFMGLFLAGLGAMLHGDLDAAHLNLSEAVAGWQLLGDTRRIPGPMWYFATQLLDAAQQAEIRPYFEDDEP